MGLELESLGHSAHKADRNRTGQAAVAKVRQNHEDHLSAALSYFLDLPEVELRGAGFHIPNERASKGEAGRLKWAGVKPGVADWLFTGPPITAIELKRDKNKQTSAQVAWAKQFVSGWDDYLEEDDWFESASMDTMASIFAPKYYVCRTLFSAVDVLYTRELLRKPMTAVGIEATVKKVLRWWLIKYKKEIE